MFEVIYMSTSYKQCAEFIDRIMWDLRKYEIYDARIDSRKLQIKTDRFIVSSVNIWGNNLGRSCRLIKYYIDDVHFSDCPSKSEIENALARQEELKCRFREGTKKISEKELVEILKEA